MGIALEQPTIHTGDNFVLVRSGARAEGRIGIYGKGSCDLKLLYGCVPLLRPTLQGTCCIMTEGSAAESRSDVLLQTLEDLPRDHIEGVATRLGLAADYFQPRLFERTFAVTNGESVEEFPKTAVCLSTAADINRTVYRHREHGFLVDPGGGWLNQSLELILGDLQVVQWFRSAFQTTGRLSVEQFVANFTRLIRLVQDRTGAHVLVFNTLMVDPGSLVHNYQFVKQCHALRRREFYLALVEMSRALDFSIIDVDRVLKKAGVRTQVDFGHPPPAFNVFLAQEVVRVLKELGAIT